ncbi:MAG TPA: hypothetical protein VNN80_23650, partial [Polyangiaceae bacterium]|nr:hypothetical protein [Polyangiaceae bacterium]
QALAAGARFVRRDLNRGWTQENLARLRRLPARELGDEDQEQLDLADALRDIERAQQGPLLVVDLHTTSAPTPPFTCFGDTLKNRRLAMALPLPATLGLEEVIEGALVGYCTERGHVGISIEAGRHADPESIEHHVAAAWLLLVAARCLPANAVPELAIHRARLERASASCPRVVEVLHRHVVRPTDNFEMLPGFTNFAPVFAGEVVAHDAHGPVRVAETGLLLMPRYQSQGEDGFFLVREVRSIWLELSELLRRAGASRLVPHLPGIHRHELQPHLLVADPRVARIHLSDVMHLLGYRRRRSSDERPMFSRRGRAR